MALGGGPTQMRPSPTTRSAKSASSDMKPYPGWTWGAGGHSSQPPHMGGVLVCVCVGGGGGVSRGAGSVAPASGCGCYTTAPMVVTHS